MMIAYNALYGNKRVVFPEFKIFQPLPFGWRFLSNLYQYALFLQSQNNLRAY